MKANTKLLIIASACLIALSLAACGNENSQEDITTPTTGETVTTEVTDATEKSPEAGTVADDPAGSLPAADTQDGDAVTDKAPSDDPAMTEPETQAEVAGPLPPAPETEAESEPATEPSMPDFGGIETSEDGVIELPFVPFPTD